MHVCLFDIDGTLIRTGGAGKLAMETAAARAFALDASEPAEGIGFAGRTDRAIARDLFEKHGIEDSIANWQHFLAEYLTELPLALAATRGRVLPGISELLEQLSRQKKRK